MKVSNQEDAVAASFGFLARIVDMPLGNMADLAGLHYRWSFLQLSSHWFFAGGGCRRVGIGLWRDFPRIEKDEERVI